MLGNDALLQRRSQILAYYLTAEKAKTWVWEEFQLWRDKDSDLRLRVVAILENTLVPLGAGSKTGRCHHSHPQFRRPPLDNCIYTLSCLLFSCINVRLSLSRILWKLSYAHTHTVFLPHVYHHPLCPRPASRMLL